MAEPCRPQLDIIVGERRLDSFGKLATRPTTTVFSTCLPSLGRTLYQWKIQTLPSFLRFCLPSYASAWSTSPFATFQPSVPVAPGTDRGRTTLARSIEAKQDFPVEETAAAISLRRKRQICRARSPIGWPGSFRALASSKTRRRVRDKKLAAQSAST